MRLPFLMLFVAIAFLGMVQIAPYGESYWMIVFGILGCVLTFIFIPKDPS